MKREDLFSNVSRPTNHCLPTAMLNPGNTVTARERDACAIFLDKYRYPYPEANRKYVTKKCNSPHEL
jgi:hypothetical protein